jgi:hypothetical protein
MKESQHTGSSTFAGRASQHTAKTCKRAFTFPNAEKKKKSQWLTKPIKHTLRDTLHSQTVTCNSQMKKSSK